MRPVSFKSERQLNSQLPSNGKNSPKCGGWWCCCRREYTNNFWFSSLRIARSLVWYSKIFGLGLGLWASTGICWVGYTLLPRMRRGGLLLTREDMDDEARCCLLASSTRAECVLNWLELLLAGALVYTTRCRPHPNRERPIKAPHTLELTTIHLISGKSEGYAPLISNKTEHF